jgi:hypothetical protein
VQERVFEVNLIFTASISRSTSRSVRCSRDRYSALGLRLGTWLAPIAL